MKSLTSQILEDILIKYKCSLPEAWEIYNRKFEDIELNYNPHKPIYDKYKSHNRVK